MKARFGSFGYAIRGMRLLVTREHNAWVDLAASVLVIAAGFFCQITRFEWCALGFAMGLVWTAEALNTAIEYLADALCPDRNQLVGQAKDLAAACVLLAASTVLFIGILVFAPYFRAFLG